MSGDTVTKPHHPSCTPSRAARDLGLKRRELELAVHLGLIRTVPDEGGGGRRVPRSEIDRMYSGARFPDSLLERVKTVGTVEGAGLMDVPNGRFTRFARLGLIVPVNWYLNRYRAVVWMYLAEELKQFATDEQNAPLLNARRTPEGLRGLLDAGVDLRPRNWRGRHRGFLLRQTDDAWERVGALAAFLDPVQIAEIVPDPYERSHLNRFRPGPPASGAPGSPAAHIADRLMTADDPDEISLLRADLTAVLHEARETRPAPRPTANRAPAPTHPVPDGSPTPKEQEPSRGLLSWLRRRTPRTTTP
ncbi:hypothetical protein SAMN04487981_101436 [Streptomyces sp. cf386]|uniref:DUF6397 family protein n=1 Tax=Streptomyces sp. cf386 TaxID=1761904 RepID=UPI00088CD118|nr:DUF6397 family protein [Streptomyces sp. cf386]SDM41396.1 hypothetical protein SAMN04487981_101436 [Streptomyces sp. cf386]